MKNELIDKLKEMYQSFINIEVEQCFGCPPNGDGKNKDGSPDKRCGGNKEDGSGSLSPEEKGILSGINAKRRKRGDGTLADAPLTKDQKAEQKKKDVETAKAIAKKNKDMKDPNSGIAKEAAKRQAENSKKKAEADAKRAGRESAKPAKEKSLAERLAEKRKNKSIGMSSIKDTIDIMNDLESKWVIK
jgi:hypothetical protein